MASCSAALTGTLRAYDISINISNRRARLGVQITPLDTHEKKSFVGKVQTYLMGKKVYNQIDLNFILKRNEENYFMLIYKSFEKVLESMLVKDGCILWTNVNVAYEEIEHESGRLEYIFDLRLCCLPGYEFKVQFSSDDWRPSPQDILDVALKPESRGILRSVEFGDPVAPKVQGKKTSSSASLLSVAPSVDSGISCSAGPSSAPDPQNLKSAEDERPRVSANRLAPAFESAIIRRHPTSSITHVLLTDSFPIYSTRL